MEGGSEAEELLGEVGGEEGIGRGAEDGGADLSQWPEAASVEFGRGVDRSVPHGEERVDQLALAVALEDVGRQRRGGETLDAQLLAGLAAQGVEDGLARVDVTAHSRVPPSRLDILPLGPQLQIQPPP